MAAMKKILHITPFFAPNIGGVETHLSDLISELDKYNYQNTVLTYSPITTTNVSWQAKEKIGRNSFVHRYRWLGFNLFHRLEKYPLLNFIYITPYLLIRSSIFLLFHHHNYNVIHSHGINGAIIGIILQKIFNIPRHVTSIYSTYDNTPLNTFSTKILVRVLNKCDHILTQSNSSITQLSQLGVNHKNISRYYHWVDLNKFKVIHKKTKEFTILFVGRMIPAKNALLIAKLAPVFPGIKFTFVGTGPDFPKLQRLSQKCSNISLIGDVPYSNLNSYYQNSNLLCVPSKYHEGWGRIIAESISCGVPVISSNLGGTMEAADTSVAVFIKPTLNNFMSEIKKLYPNSTTYQKLKQNCRPYALKHYSKKNLRYITKSY